MREVRLLPAAQRELRRLDNATRRRIAQALRRLAETAHGDVRQLQGRRGEWRLRVGDWRVIFFYDQADGAIVVTRIARRAEGTYRR